MDTKTPQSRWDEVGVVALVPDRWGPQWQVRHHVLSRLSNYFNVVWMNYPFGWRECLSAANRMGSKAFSQASDNLHIYEPAIWLPRIGRPRWIERLTFRNRLSQARRMLDAKRCQKVVLSIWRPEFASALHELRHDLSMYHVDDEYSFSSHEAETSEREKHLLQSSDQVFIHSPALIAKKGGFNPNTEFLPNGVDYGAFATPAPEPSDMRTIPHPRVGYIGYLKRMLDWPLLLHLSAAHPEWSFVFVGRESPHPEISQFLNLMRKMPNVHFLGEKPTARLGAYAQHFDACLMPYRLDDYTKYIYPLKLHEYLASGPPVISSAIPSVEAFREVVTIAQSADEWATAIQEAVAPSANELARRAQRQHVAHEHDWDALAAQVAFTIARRLDLCHQPYVQSIDPSLPGSRPELLTCVR